MITSGERKRQRLLVALDLTTFLNSFFLYFDVTVSCSIGEENKNARSHTGSKSYHGQHLNKQCLESSWPYHVPLFIICAQCSRRARVRKLCVYNRRDDFTENVQSHLDNLFKESVFLSQWNPQWLLPYMFEVRWLMHVALWMQIMKRCKSDECG